MDVLKEILEWSEDRPDWQRDALRRLVVNGELNEDDINELTNICKRKHGLSDLGNAIPITEKDLPNSTSESGKVTLQSIYHHSGVNALAEKQTVNFCPSLTVVYGDNAAGKSGYTRILKSACRARGTEEILGNVFSGTSPTNPIVSIKYKLGNGEELEWTGNGNDESISRVNVFDSHSASVYLTKKTDVAYRPFGLDLFDKLVQACIAVRSNLENERKTLSVSLIKALEVPDGTEVSKLLSNITSLTEPEKVQSLASLNEEEKSRCTLLEKLLLDLQIQDPSKAAQELEIRAERLTTLIQRLEHIDDVLSVVAVNTIFQTQIEAETKRADAEKLRDSTFKSGLLEGTGSDNWKDMWDAARHFSKNNAYPEEIFPFTDEGANCLLCQQDLSEEAITRLNQFEKFVTSEVEKESRAATNKYEMLLKGIEQINVRDESIEKIIKEIRLEHEDLAYDLEENISKIETIRSSVVTRLKDRSGIPDIVPQFDSMVSKLLKLKIQIEERIKELRNQNDATKRERINTELKELQARQTLEKHQGLVLDEIERIKKIAAYGLCINDTRTHSITTKSTEVTKIAVTDQLKKSFKEELEKLNFKHVEVELREAGGDLGNLYHNLVLKRAPGVELEKVVSEGEARCLSIAAFFAEVSTADEYSAILFDDPVSSLDYKWRENVAFRLVEESKSRQVIVFTHDIVFLLILHQFAKQEKVPLLDQHVRQLNIGAGVCEDRLPWVAMAAKKRIGFLKDRHQEADKLFRDGHKDAYEREAAYIYGLLREAWERGLEEILLNGVVERYRQNVQTQQILIIADITEEDCKAVDIGMTKCSQWLTGHDQSPSARQDMPEPDELIADIETFDIWVKNINRRRN